MLSVTATDLGPSVVQIKIIGPADRVQMNVVVRKAAAHAGTLKTSRGARCAQRMSYDWTMNGSTCEYRAVYGFQN